MLMLIAQCKGRYVFIMDGFKLPMTENFYMENSNLILMMKVAMMLTNKDVAVVDTKEISEQGPEDQEEEEGGPSKFYLEVSAKEGS